MVTPVIRRVLISTRRVPDTRDLMPRGVDCDRQPPLHREAHRYLHISRAGNPTTSAGSNTRFKL
jgi:hypothetical protein